MDHAETALELQKQIASKVRAYMLFAVTEDGKPMCLTMAVLDADASVLNSMAESIRVEPKSMEGMLWAKQLSKHVPRLMEKRGVPEWEMVNAPNGFFVRNTRTQEFIKP